VIQSNRPDGTINSSPQVALVSPVVILHSGQSQIISIPVIDQDNDTVQCRFANTSTECGDACMSNTRLTNAILSNNCTLIISASQSTGWYPVSIQIEDFLPGNNTPLSSTPFQFFIHIQYLSLFNCKQAPILNSSITTLIQNVTINIPFSFQLIASTTCAYYWGWGVTMDNILTFALLNIVKSPLVRIGRSQQTWKMNVLWTPTSQQIGLQLLCMVAVDSQGLQSKQLCQKFMVNSPITSSFASSSYNSSTTLIRTYSVPFSSYTKTFNDNSIISFEQLNQSMTLDLSGNTIGIIGFQFNSTISDLVNINVTNDDNFIQQFVNLSVIYVNLSLCQLVTTITFQSKNVELLKNISRDLQLIICHISTTCNYTTENDIMDQDSFIESFDIGNNIMPLDQIINTLNQDFSFESNALNYSIDIYFNQNQLFLLENLTIVMLDDIVIDWIRIYYILPDRSIVKGHFLSMLNSLGTSSIIVSFPCISSLVLSGIRIIFGPTNDNSTLDHLALSIDVRNCSSLSYNSKYIQ
ncbi:unnamed protein product, partial [Adineta ricciae]